MIVSVSSNHSSHYHSSNRTSNADRGQQLPKALPARLDSNGRGAVSQDELNSAPSQKSDNGMRACLSKNPSDLNSQGSGTNVAARGHCRSTVERQSRS
ncbi:hypothetical protein [Pseudomonas sp. LD120]|uniref:hypothetical protein n=1 Tax=Pseudomonas sp. LD120 TaxID=485751 RepID=UPI001358664A|nr:hypothetical protein [Pseudomonas sp. LD120]KAF0863702.1 hypothetical protein PLD_23915 [Pseudomonas sp. LD120]